MVTSEKVVSISAIIIAMASIFITLWQGIEMRNHNRLSVRPNLELVYNVDSETFGYQLENKGLGPAIICNKTIYIDSTEAISSGFSGLDSILSSLELGDRKMNHAGLGKGRSIRSEEKVNLFRFNFLPEDDKEQVMKNLYMRLAIEIEYESMYGEKFTCRIPGDFKPKDKGDD